MRGGLSVAAFDALVAPTISGTPGNGTVGTAYSFTPTATGTPAPTFTAVGLPPGMSVDTATGALSGTPTTGGSYGVTITATNAAGTAALNATIVIAVTPVDGVCGAADGLAVSVAPSANLCTTGSASAVAGSGPWTWSCAGANGGNSVNCSAPLAAPTISGTPGNGIVGTVYSVTPTATGSPTFTATGLPPGLSIDAATGEISGTPTTVGSYAITITATNAGGTADLNATIVIAAAAPPTPVPTLSEWGMLILPLLLAGAALWGKGLRDPSRYD